MNKSNKIKNYS